MAFILSGAAYPHNAVGRETESWNLLRRTVTATSGMEETQARRQLLICRLTGKVDRGEQLAGKPVNQECGESPLH